MAHVVMTHVVMAPIVAHLDGQKGSTLMVSRPKVQKQPYEERQKVARAQ